MILYEFQYVDNQNLSEQEVIERMQKFLEPVPGWAPGYKVILAADPVKNDDGSTSYSLIVCGELED